ncbi:hypothetical protein DFH09DRAFT_1185237 [Mycena vulgaris]|nr:hypothetical protein DFH09DRAFT_1185237 [Mycena vulgaris]
MFPQKFETPVDSSSTKSGVSIEDFHPYVQSRLPRRGFWRHAFGWPATIIFGQLVLQMMGWGLFAVVEHHGQVALPFTAALWVENHPQSVTLVATLISTVLAYCSTLLFSFAVRKSILLHLYRPMALDTLSAAVNISAGSPAAFHRWNWKWPLTSWIFLTMTGFQTSGWSTLITPVRILIPTSLAGSELDLSSPILQQMAINGEYEDCMWGANLYGSVMAGAQESGYAATKSFFGFPATLTLMDQSFNMSTGGILATHLTDVNASTWFANMTVLPATTRSTSPLPSHSFSTNYSMVQQGFTADVSCNFRQIGPDVEWLNDTVKDWENGSPQPLGGVQWVEMKSNCPIQGGLNLTNVFTDSSFTYVALIACAPAPGTHDNYTLIFRAGGWYDWINGGLDYVTCELSPKTTTVFANYAGLINTTSHSFETTPASGGPAGLFSVYSLIAMVEMTQGRTSNVVGDHFYSIASEPNWNDTKTLRMMEQYVKGVVEYSGSVLRACLSGKTTSFPDGVPSNMTIPTNGTFYTETLGWTYSSGSTLFVLVPGTFIALISIFLVVVTLYRHSGYLLTPEAHSFDPSDPLHLMAVAAPGGLPGVFRGLEKKDMKTSGSMRVVLGSIPGHGPALVRADEHDMSSDTLSLLSLPRRYD